MIFMQPAENRLFAIAFVKLVKAFRSPTRSSERNITLKCEVRHPELPSCEPQGLLFFGAPSRANSGASRSHSAHGGRMRGWSGGMNGVGCKFWFAKKEQKQKQNTDKKKRRRNNEFTGINFERRVAFTIFYIKLNYFI